MTAGIVGVCLLGAVLGYLTHFLVRRDAKAGIKDLAAIVGVLLGDVIFKVVVGEVEANWYMIGIGLGFFLYWAALMIGRETVKTPIPLTASERGLRLFPFLKSHHPQLDESRAP
jgi:ABC-type uncharacterized transport system permease subunit